MTIIRLGGKVNDMGWIIMDDPEAEEEIARVEDDYLPNISCICGGDYIDIDIDNETGLIIGWVPLTIKDFEKCEQ